MAKTKNINYVVIGNSAAGISAMEAIRNIDSASKIINISKESTIRPYSRCLLSYYLAGAMGKERLWIRDKNFYNGLNIDTRIGTEAISIDAKNKKIKLSDKETIDYDKLLFAAGAEAKKIAIKGIDKKGVFYLRTIEDAEGILAILKDVKKVCILGGGLVGMRVAYSLSRQGKSVQVVVKSKHIFSQMLDFESSDMIRRHLESNGIAIYTTVEAVEILGKGKVDGVILDDGNKLECDLIIIGKGVSPNVGLLKDKVKVNAGVVANEFLETSDNSIYAAGDVAEAFDPVEKKNNINAIWTAAVRQGKIAGLNMAGKSTAYEGSVGMNSLDFFGISVISFGIVKPPDESFEEVIQADFSRNIYRKVVLKNNIIVGAVFVSDILKHGVILNLALNKVDVSDIKDILADEYFDYGKVMPLILRQKDKFKRPEYEDTAMTYR